MSVEQERFSRYPFFAMGLLVRTCPNLECKYSKKTSQRFYSKTGTFLSKWNGHRVPRYRCRECGKNFSSSTFRNTYYQKKPYLNKSIFELYSSGTCQRRLAKVLRVDRKTIARKFYWLSKWARDKHEKMLHDFKTNHIQFDEMESFEHTRLKPLSIGLAVEANSAKIIDIQVGTLNYKGRLASFAFSKYGSRIDTSEKAVKKVFETIQSTGMTNPTITTDSKGTYPRLIKAVLPDAVHRPTKSTKISMAQRLFRKGRRNEDDPLFVLNYTAAKIRHDLSRMGRKVWVTTKHSNYLQAHLNLYIAYSNGYQLPR